MNIVHISQAVTEAEEAGNATIFFCHSEVARDALLAELRREGYTWSDGEELGAMPNSLMPLGVRVVAKHKQVWYPSIEYCLAYANTRIPKFRVVL
jgi:hypothetical protein